MIDFHILFPRDYNFTNALLLLSLLYYIFLGSC